MITGSFKEHLQKGLNELAVSLSEKQIAYEVAKIDYEQTENRYNNLKQFVLDMNKRSNERENEKRMQGQ